MNKKDFITPVLILGISALFACICLMVYLNKGKSEKWTSRKMLIGGILLSLTATVNSCRITHKCYAAPAIKGFEISGGNSNNEIIITNNRTLNGKLFDWFSQHATFIITDKNSEIVQTGSITPVDGALDTGHEDIKFTVSNKLSPGNYDLMIYDTEESKTNKNHYIHKFSLTIE